ncbi:MAG TPA: VWA domain-containing protein [Pyrinomonadaceae bacterium]|nr:VWA domain-containing protein [Pyrinomonadaceae bacterium]
MTAASLFSTRNLIIVFLLVSSAHSTLLCRAQTSAPAAPSKAPETQVVQDSVRISIEEVRVPVTAIDAAGRFDPTVVIDDLMLREDGVVQQLRGLYRIPGSVLLVLDTGGEQNLAKSVRLTREVAEALVSAMQNDDQIAVMQVNNRVELVQEWTRNKPDVIHSLEKRLFPGKQSALGVALVAAAQYFDKVPSTNHHLVLVSDGVVRKTTEPELEEAFKSMIAANITVHVISYTSLGLKAKKSEPTRPRVKSAVDKNLIDALPNARFKEDPTPDLKTSMGAKGGVAIDIDRLLGVGIKKTLKEREKQFLAITEETGGTISFPASAAEMVDQAADVAREVDSQYILSYRPLRPRNSATANEYRRINIFSRRAGLNVRARRGYVATIPK